MKGFFKETEIRNFSFEDKLKWALRNIVNCCHLTEVRKIKIREETYYYSNTRKYHTFPECSFKVPEKLPESEFDDLKFWIEDDVCHIELDNAKYIFHLSMLLRVEKGLLKAMK